MSTPRILLVGYYGKGNFGDDVLLRVTHGIVRQAFANADIGVIADGEHSAYVKTLLPDVSVRTPGRYGHVDLIVHGGGGVYFDFTTHSLLNRAKEFVVQAMGLRSYVALEGMLRRIAGKPRTSASTRLGFGIGVGSYTPGSPRLRAALPILADYDALWVRDSASIVNLKRFAPILNAPVIEGSDLAFLTHHWVRSATSRGTNAKPRLGIILRDWPEARGGTAHADLQTTLAALAVTYDLTGFIFDHHADPETTRLLAPYVTVTWKPETMTIEAFSQQLASQDVLLTSRAHGAICGACLGVPSVIVAIEPKLEQVAAMLPQAAMTVPAQHTANWAATLEQAHRIGAAEIAADVERNRAMSQAALDQMQRWLA